MLATACLADTNQTSHKLPYKKKYYYHTKGLALIIISNAERNIHHHSECMMNCVTQHHHPLFFWRFFTITPRNSMSRSPWFFNTVCFRLIFLCLSLKVPTHYHTVRVHIKKDESILPFLPLILHIPSLSLQINLTARFNCIKNASNASTLFYSPQHQQH